MVAGSVLARYTSVIKIPTEYGTLAPPLVARCKCSYMSHFENKQTKFSSCSALLFFNLRCRESQREAALLVSAAEGLNEALTLHSGPAHSSAGGAELLQSVRFACFQSSPPPPTLSHAQPCAAAVSRAAAERERGSGKDYRENEHRGAISEQICARAAGRAGAAVKLFMISEHPPSHCSLIRPRFKPRLLKPELSRRERQHQGLDQDGEKNRWSRK